MEKWQKNHYQFQCEEQNLNYFMHDNITAFRVYESAGFPKKALVLQQTDISQYDDKDYKYLILPCN